MAIDVSYRDTYTTSAEDLSRTNKNFIVNEGVAFDGMTVTQSGTPGMSVVVAPGTGYFYGSGSNANVMYEFYSDANETVTIGASGVSARIDIICLKVDASTGVASIVAIAGTPSGSPAVPATPASHYKLAEVAVGAGVTTITNANITDTRAIVELRARNILTGWNALSEANVEFNTTKSIKTTTDIDLTSILQEGDKLTFNQSTGGTKYFWISDINYNSTVANRTYIELISNDTVANQAITLNSVKFSRIANPLGFPVDPTWGQVTAKTGGSSQATPTQNVWYNLGGSISLPKGRWLLEYNAGIAIERDTSAATAIILEGRAGLSTSSSGDPSSFANGVYWKRIAQDIRYSSSTITKNNLAGIVTASAYYTATSAQTIHLNFSTSRTDATLLIGGSVVSSFITATPAYK
jgi:hypothetical protein